MRNKFQLTCCNTTDLTREYFNRREIPLAYFHFTIDDKVYRDDFGESLPFPEFYGRMNGGASPETSQVNTSAYIQLFEPLLQEGNDILHLTLSSGITGSYDSAKIAEKELREKYPERKLVVMDSLAASAGYGLLVDAVCDLRDSGKDIDEAVKWVEENILFVNHWFFTSELKHLRRGGRISGTAALLGSMLNICPVFNVNSEGRLIPRAKVRGKKNVIEDIVRRMSENAEKKTEYSGKVFISNSDCLEDARELERRIRETFPRVGSIDIFDIGAVIGSHVGPGTVSLFFWGDKRGI